MLLKQKILLAVIALLTSASAFGGGLEVYPSGGVGSFPVMPNRSISTSSDSKITAEFYFQCYGINNRAPESPAATDGCIRTTLALKGRPHPIDFIFPGAYLDPHGVQLVNQTCRGDTQVGGKYQGKLIFENPNPPTNWHHILEWNPNRVGADAATTDRLMVTVSTDYVPETVVIGDDGIYKLDARKTEIEGRVQVRQTGILQNRNGHYFGMNAPLSNHGSGAHPSVNGQLIRTFISVPGASYTWQRAGGRYRGFCGSFYSPLMLFFDKKRPKFHGAALFPLLTTPANYAWPEPNAPGFFLALDRNHNGEIDSGDELFGLDAKGTYRNGFEKLKALDKNKDGVIDAKDPQFSELMLWGDRNGDGQTDPGELIPMGEKRVVKISLNYDASSVTPMGGVAELRERAEFLFLGKDGSLQKGEVIDVWLSPVSVPTFAKK